MLFNKMARGLRTLVVAIAMLASAPAAYASDAIVLDRIVAVVNKDAITWSELYRAMEVDFEKYLLTMDEKSRAAFLKSREGVYLDNLINVRIQMQNAKKLGIAPKPAEVEAAINGIRQKNGLKPDEFLRELKLAGFSEETYRKTITEQITVQRIIDREVRRKVHITDEDVKDYLKRNNIVAEGRFLRIRQAYFKLPKADGVETVKARIALFMEEYNSGKDFGELSSKYSESSIAESGGEMGYIHESKLSTEFKSAALDLMPGDVSRPFQSSLGIHVIKIEDARPASKMLEEERFEATYRDWLRTLREDAMVDVRL